MDKSIRTQGLQYFYRGNFYACRNLWEDALKSETDLESQAFLYNALGAVYYRIRGAEAAESYFHRALELLPDEPLENVALQARTNLIFVLAQMGHIGAALQVVTDTMQRPMAASTFKQASFAVHVFYTWSRAEMYRNILESLEWAEGLFVDLPPSRWRDDSWTALHHYAGHAAQMLDEPQKAILIFQRALKVARTSDTLRDLAKTYLIMGEFQQAVAYMKQWQSLSPYLASETEGMELANTLELLAMFAWLDGEKRLFERCTEKAELYYGQESHWAEWLRVRNLDSYLSSRFNLHRLNKGEVAGLQWGQWGDFLEELNLRDSFHAMFPSLSRMLRSVANLSIRLYSEWIGTQDRSALLQTEHAAHLAYIGLPAVATSTAEALGILRSPNLRSKLTDNTIEVLGIYPWGQVYRQILTFTCTVLHTPETQEEIIAQVLALTLRYVELIELFDFTHAAAMDTACEEFRQGPKKLLQTFTAMFQFDIDCAGEIPSD